MGPLSPECWGPVPQSFPRQADGRGEPAEVTQSRGRLAVSCRLPLRPSPSAERAVRASPHTACGFLGAGFRGRASPAGVPLSHVGGGHLHAAHRCVPTPAISHGQHPAGVQGRGPQSPPGIGCFSGPPASVGNCTPPPPTALAADSPPGGQGVPLTGTCTPRPSPRASSLVSGPSFCAMSSGKVGAMLATSAWTLIPAGAHCVPRPEPRACPCWASPPNAPQSGRSLWNMHASQGAWDGQGGAPPQGHHLPEEVPSLGPGPSAPSSGSWCCGCSTNKKARLARSGVDTCAHMCTHALRCALTINIKIYDPSGREGVLGVQWTVLTPEGTREGLKQPCTPSFSPGPAPPWTLAGELHTADTGKRDGRCRETVCPPCL